MYAAKANELGDMFGAIDLVELRGGRLQVILNRLAAEVTANEYPVLLGVLNQALNYGVLTETLVANYLSVTTKPPLQPKGEPLSLTAEQLQVLRREFRLYAPGTVVYTPGKGVWRQNELKRERQKRGLTLATDGMAMEALCSAVALCPPDRRRPDDPVLSRVEPGVSPWINAEVPSEHLDAVTRRPAVVESLAKTGMRPGQLSPKTLRSTVATLVARGEGEERAQEVLAHNEVRTTRTSYITPEGKTVGLETLDALLTVWSANRGRTLPRHPSHLAKRWAPVGARAAQSLG